MLSSTSFNDWNLPSLMHNVANWIGSNEINVSDILVDAYNDDSNNPISSTVWRIRVYYIEDKIPY